MTLTPSNPSLLDHPSNRCNDGKAFRITDPQRFADRCLPRFFKHNKLGSFQQQLLTYGFSRVPNESCLDISAIWQHPKFIAGRPELLEQITRATAKRGPDSSEGAPSKLDADGAAGGNDGSSSRGNAADGDEKDELIGMQDHLGRLTQSLNEMHAELKTARSYEMSVLDELVRKVDRRLKRNGNQAAAAPAPSSAAAAEAMEVAAEPAEGAQALAALGGAAAAADGTEG